MSFYKNLKKTLQEQTSLQKKEDPAAYAKLASEGLLLGHPVKIKGHEKRSDNNVPYHTSIKFFGKDKDKEEHAHKEASKLEHQHIDPKKVGIEPGKIKSRAGEDIYVLKLHGPHADNLKEQHKKFSHMGHKENYEFHPHISVSKDTHDEIKNKGHKTAHDAGIEFGHAELKRGPKTLQTYKPKEKMAKSENDSETTYHGTKTPFEGNFDLKHHKSGFYPGVYSTTDKNRAEGFGPHVYETKVQGKHFEIKDSKHADELQNKYSPHTKGSGVAVVEGLKREGYTGIKRGNERITFHPDHIKKQPIQKSELEKVEKSENTNIIKETVSFNNDLKEYRKILVLDGDNLKYYLQDNAGLESKILKKHEERVKFHFGNDLDLINIALQKGIKEAYRAKKEK